MGQSQNTLSNDQNATARRRLPPRLCLRKGCGKRFQPNRWNQRYCQQPHCLQEVRRWHAAKRQRKRRLSPEHRQQHAQAERQRRIQKKRQAASPISAAHQDSPPAHRAWSRSKKFCQNFCDRPGCYEPRRTSCRTPAKYCGDSCRQAVRRVTDRERKWLRRNTSVGHFKRNLEYQQRIRNTPGRLPQDAGNKRFKSDGGGGGAIGGRRLFAVF